MHAELAYVFRHALLRAAAYELQLPTERAQLHALALHTMEHALAGMPDVLNAAAQELADHAAQGASTDATLGAREVHWLLRAARLAKDNYRHDAEADCLRRLVAHACTTPVQQREALEDLANSRSRAGRPADALEHFSNLLAQASQQGDAQAELTALTGIGQALRQMDRLPEAGAILLRAVESASQGATTDKLAVAAGMLGVLREIEGRFDEAAQWYEQSLVAARACGNRKSEELALGNRANLHLVQHQPAQAMDLYKQALRISVGRGDLRTQGVWTGNIALAHGRMGDSAQAEQMIEQCLQLARCCGDLRTEATMLLNLASHQMESARWPECTAHVRTALELVHELQNPALEATAFGYLGRIELEQGRAESAEPLLAKALAAAKRSGIAREIGKALGYHTGALKALGRLEEARTRLAEAAAVSQRMNDFELTASWLTELAILEREQGNEAAAGQAWQQAETALGQLGDMAIDNRLRAKFAAAIPT